MKISSLSLLCMSEFLTQDLQKNYVALWLSLIFLKEKFCITAFYDDDFFLVVNGGFKKKLTEYSDVKVFFKINEAN